MKRCPLCRVPYANRSEHLRRVHGITDHKQRILMLGMASGRYAGPLGCPLSECHGKSYVRLDRHLRVVHRMEKDARKLLLEETKKKEIASQLSAMRKNKTPAGSASQPPKPKKHKKDFEYLIAKFFKSNLRAEQEG